MVEFDIAENVQPSRKRQVLAAFIANIGTINVGVVMGYSAFALPQMEQTEDYRSITMSEKTWIASIVTLGILLSNSFTQICQEKLGRKSTILFMAIPLNVAWIIIVCASDVILICIGRFLTGLSAGSFLIAVPLYVKETSHESLHKNLECLNYSMVSFGILLSYIAGYSLDLLWLPILCSVAPMLLIWGMIYMPESPYFLIRQGKLEKAARSLKWLGVSEDGYDIKLKITEIQRIIEEHDSKRQNRSWKYFFSLEKIKATLTCIVFSFVQQFNLMNIIISYSFYTIRQISITSSFVYTPFISILLSVVSLLSILLSSFSSNSREKVFLCISIVGSSISLGILGLLWFFKASLDPLVFMYAYLAVLLVYVIVYGIGLGYLPFAFSQKSLPGLNSGLTFICTWSAAFAITKTFYDLNSYFAFEGILYLSLAILTLVSLPFVYCIPNPSEDSN